jgi:soluble lytic murein transglycosylase-like protein
VVVRLLDKIGLSFILAFVLLSVFSLYIFPKEGATGMEIVESGKQKYLNGEVFASEDVYTIPEDLLVRNLSLTKEEERKLLEQYVEDLKAGRVSVEVDHIISDEITKYINHWGKEIGVEPELIRGLMKQESNFNPTVISKSGAMGLMQIMPATAKDLGLDNPWDISDNIKAGTKHLKWLLGLYNGDYSLALAAYNAGHGNVNKWLKDSRYSKNGRLTNIPFAETKHYVPIVLKNYNIYKSQR